jgi:hypothetical protein
LNWKLLSKGLGTVWLCGCLAASYIPYSNWGGYNENSKSGIMLLIGFGVFGYAIAFVVAAACPAPKK